MTNRRNFLKKSAMIASSSIVLPRILSAEEEKLDSIYQGKKLVVVQLGGGNDGLNTVIPYNNEVYYQMRPTLAIPREQVIRVNEELGLHPALKTMQPLIEKGEMAIINNVGYPNPDRSHFRSMDIWQSASDADAYLKTGWLGRMLDSCCPQDASQYFGLEAGEILSLALKGERMKGIAVQDIERLYRTANDPFLENIATAHHSEGDSVDYLYKTLMDARKSVTYLKEKSEQYHSDVVYPENALASDLSSIARLINAGAETRVYYTSLSGFDTHAYQLKRQHEMLKKVSDALAAFVADLRQAGQLDSTMVLVFSEFGRSVRENGSGGTDHGTANNVWILGGNLKKSGFVNEGPDLFSLDEEDLKYSVDFRSVYATLLDNFLEADSRKILGGTFEHLGFV